MNNFSVKAKLSILVAISMIALIIVAVTSLFSLKSALLHEKEDKVKNLVQSAIKNVDYFYKEFQNGKMSEDDAKQQAKNVLSHLRYNESDYFFIINDKPEMVMHPIKPELNGKNISASKDPNGKQLFIEMVKVSSNGGGGFVDYVWDYPTTKKPESKISYVQMYEQWKWIVGTGIYIVDLEEAFHKESMKLFMIIGIALIVLIALAFVVIKNIQLSLNTFKDGLNEFFAFLNRESSGCQPINILTKDEFGTMTQVVNQNINKTKENINIDNILIANVKEIVDTIQKGHLTSKVEKSSNNPSLNELKELINKMVDTLRINVGKDINQILDTLNSYSNHNYTKSIDDQQGKVSVIVNTLGETITNMLIENKKNGMILEAGASRLSHNVEVLNTSANEQAASLEETAASLEEMTSNIQNSTQKAQEMKERFLQTIKSANDGKALASKTAHAMQDINNSTSAINDAITIIDQIAFQTNILSLNAAVEAATAGEAGKGFAVVAGEVRNLANRSAEAANSIKNLVTEATTKTSEGKSISDEMIKGYEDLSQIISENTTVIEDVANASKEQLIGISQINDAISQLEQATQGNARVASYTNDIARETSDIAKAVVQDVDAKEFRGKHNIKLPPRNDDVQHQVPKVSSSTKSHNKPSSAKPVHNHSHDSWDSF